VLNLGRGSDRRGEEAAFELPKDLDVTGAKLLITNKKGLEEGGGIVGGKIELGKYEGRVYVL
jgi:hypothetical protein